MVGLFTVIVAIVSLNLPSAALPAPCQGQALPAATAAALEKRIGELEARIAPLQKELLDRRRQLHEQSPVTLVPVKYIDAVQAAEVLGKAYQSTPGVVVAALPWWNCVAFRADGPTTREITDALRRLDEIARSTVGGVRFGRGRGWPQAPSAPRVRLDERTELVALIELLAKQRPAGKK